MNEFALSYEMLATPSQDFQDTYSSKVYFSINGISSFNCFIRDDHCKSVSMSVPRARDNGIINVNPKFKKSVYFMVNGDIYCRN